MIISRKEAVAIINSTRGRIFSVRFIKRTDGKVRDMVCRLHVKKGVKGVGMAYDPTSKGLVPVYDMQKHGFRMIPIEGIRVIKYAGQYYQVRH